MNLFKFIKWTSFVTLLALVYISMQMRIIDLAYFRNAQEKSVQKLNETNGHLTYEILTLTSANNIGKNILDDDLSDLRFADTNSVVTISAPSSKRSSQKPVYVEELKSSFLSFLSFDKFSVNQKR